MRLILVRHAQPDWAPGGVSTNEPDLTELGWDQARLLAGRAGRWSHVTELLVSPLARAQQTAEPVAEALGLEPHTHQWIREMGNPPEWEGAPVDHVLEALTNMFEKPPEAWWDGAPGGENLRAFTDRVTGGLEEALSERGVLKDSNAPRLWKVDDPDQTIVVVGHGGANSIMLAHLTGADPVPWEWERYSANHASVTLLTSGAIAGRHLFSLRRFSDVSHLPDDLVTV